MNSKYLKILIFTTLVLSILAFFILGIDGYFTIESIKQITGEITAYRDSFPYMTAFMFVLIYVGGTSLSLPVAGILSITGGALFGLIWGTVLVSIAGTIGATIAFILSRYLFRDVIQQRYEEKLAIINEGIKRNGKIYLLSLRLIPVIPYFIINAVMGITPMPLLSFSLITMVGMVPATCILVNGGVQIATINSIQDIMTVKVIFAFILIGMIPLIAHRFARHLYPKNNP